MYKLLSLVLVAFTMSAVATFPYNGVVTNLTGSPIEGVNVLLLQTKETTLTNNRGHFWDYQSALLNVSQIKNLVKPALDKNKFFYSANEVGERVALSLFSLQGKRVVSK